MLQSIESGRPIVVGQLWSKLSPERMWSLLSRQSPRVHYARGAIIHPLGGSLLARGLLWNSAKLENILGDLGDRPRFRSSVHEHIGFHDLATDWPQ